MSERETQKYYNWRSQQGWGLLIGFSIGAAIGFAVADFALWIVIGMALGIVFEATMTKK
jgi:hypothetical protein